MDNSIQNLACLSRKSAERYFFISNFGRSFANALLALKLKPEWKNQMKKLLTTSLCNWGEQLEAKKRYSDLFNCYEAAIEVFPENEEILNNYGAHLFRVGNFSKASLNFENALKINPNFVPAYRNLQSVSNLLVERWHFRMLNDGFRNDVYREAIRKKVLQGFDFVLDIGTGTGLLSYFAVAGGSTEVYACDYSMTMINTAREISRFNGMSKNIRFVCKLSNELTIPYDLPRRVSLVVTETMDAGLFGEHLLQTLIHAWKYLLLPPLPPESLVPPVECIDCRNLGSRKVVKRNGIVLPLGASLWFAAVECNSIAHKNRLLSENKKNYKKLKFPFLLTSSFEEPYDSENMKNVFNGYKILSKSVKCFYVNFNDLNQLEEYFNGKYDDFLYNLTFTSAGSLDCFMFWFDLYVDEDIKLSSSPIVEDPDFSTFCWDQAIFPVQNQINVSPNSTMNVKIQTKNGILGIKIIDSENLTSYDGEILIGSQDTIKFMNNSSLMKSFESVASVIGNCSSILDFSPLPMLYLNFLNNSSGSDNCFHVAKTENDINIIKKIVSANKLDINLFNIILESDFESKFLSNSDIKLDVVITNLFESTGEMKESSINHLPLIRKFLKPNGKILPEKIVVCGQLISSTWLKRSAQVINEGLIKKFSIADFINKFKTTQQVDLCMSSIEHVAISDEFQILELTIDDLIDKECKEFHCNIPVIRSGEATAIVFWYQLELIAGCVGFSTKSIDSHINQNAYVCEKIHDVTEGAIFKFGGKFQDGGFIFKTE